MDLNYFENIKKKQLINTYFQKTCEVLKSLGDYDHLLFSAGNGDDVVFNIDPNIGEFTVDALRIALLMYTHQYPEINFPSELLSDEVNTNIFTFANGVFHQEFVKYLATCILSNKDFVFPFLPRINSSHWYTFCIQPNKERIVILNPLQDTSEEEKKFLFNICNILMGNVKNILISYGSNYKSNYNLLFENVGLQTSRLSCGETTLMIALSIMTNGEEGYTNLIKYFQSDNMLSSLLDIYEIAFNTKCTCKNCIEYVNQNKINENDENYANDEHEKYKKCISCYEKNEGSIGINNYESHKCIFCNSLFDFNNHEIIITKKNLNKKTTELFLRNEILDVVRKSSIENIKKGCNKSEELIQVKKELYELKNKYKALLETICQK